MDWTLDRKEHVCVPGDRVRVTLPGDAGHRTGTVYRIAQNGAVDVEVDGKGGFRFDPHDVVVTHPVEEEDAWA